MADERRPGFPILALLGTSAAAALIGFAISVTGGGTVEIGGATLRLHSAGRFWVLAIVATALAIMRGADRNRAALLWWSNAIERHASPIAAGVAALSVVSALSYGTFAVGGSDSYCYLNQAELLATGKIHERQPLAEKVPWPNGVAMVVPQGHIPVADGTASVVPMCPAGYPLLLAPVRRLAGRAAMFWVVPIFGGLAVWLAFLIGRRLAGGAVGLAAAMWLAVSAAFMHQTFQPMSDVPATMFWVLALYFAVGPRREQQRAIAAGLSAAVAVTIRPNLVPLAGIAAAMLAFGRPWREGVAVAMRFALGVLPGILVVLAMQQAAYGSALTSGYGNLGGLFRPDHVWPNLSRYPVWLVNTETPAIALSLLAPLLATGAVRRSAAWLLAFAAVTVALYVPYMVFDGWWYLRFLLPAYPPLLILTAMTVTSAIRRLPLVARGLGFTAVVGIGAVVLLHLTIAHGAFASRDFERRYRDAGAYVATELPPNATLIAEELGGAIRFYSGRPTMNWRPLEVAWLDRVVDQLRERGLRPFLMFELAEEQEFRDRFGAASRWGRLDWPPSAEIDRKIRVYDPADRDRIARGEVVVTRQIWSR